MRLVRALAFAMLAQRLHDFLVARLVEVAVVHPHGLEGLGLQRTNELIHLGCERNACVHESPTDLDAASCMTPARCVVLNFQ